MPYKILPNPPFAKEGVEIFPLYKRGVQRAMSAGLDPASRVFHMDSRLHGNDQI
jgi:hypothetical protein